MLHFGIIPGDVAGKIRIECAQKVLSKVAVKCDFEYQLEHYDLGAENYIETGELISDSQIKALGATDGVLLGGFGDPRLDRSVCEKGIIARLCSELNLFVTMRHVGVFSPYLCPLRGKDDTKIDFVVVRENTETSYSDLGAFIHKHTPDELALLHGVFIRKTVEKVVRAAFELAHRRTRRTLTLVDRQQRVPAHDLPRRVFAEIGREFPDVTTNTLSAEESAGLMCCRPELYDVIITTADIGDMLMGMGQELQGGAGFGAMSYLNPGQISMFVPCVASYEDSDSLYNPNPIGAIGAMAQMLAMTGLWEPSMLIHKAITKVVSDNSSDLVAGQYQTAILTDQIIRALEAI